MGPASPYVSKIRNYYIKEILIKISRQSNSLLQSKALIKTALKQLYEDKSLRGLIAFADVDPG
jgi:primosomal protein N' (replication factor Y)